MCSPRVPAVASMFCRSGASTFRPAMAGARPIWRKGPAVWEAVSFKCSAISAPLLEPGPVPAAQYDVEAIGQQVERFHRRHIKARGQAGDGFRIADRVEDGTERHQGIALEI